MSYIAFGLNFNTAPVAVREPFELQGDAIGALYALDPPLCSDWMLLSTCNRMEVYLYGEPAEAEAIRAALAERAGVAWPAGSDFELHGDQAVKHVVEVVAGIRSQVLGDAQILAQTKDAYRLAARAGSVSTAMHRLMHTAFSAAKATITETGLGNGRNSVATAAVTAAFARFRSGDGQSTGPQSALVLGTGQMGSLVLAELRRRGVSRCVVANRTNERARIAAQKHGAVAVEWSARLMAVASADLVFVTTGAPTPVLMAADLPDSRPLLVVDLSVPRNVDPGVGERTGVELLDIDALGLKAGEAGTRQRLARAREICAAKADELTDWANREMTVQPAIHALAATFEAVRVVEVERNLRRFDEAHQPLVDELTRSIMQKLLTIPIVHLRDMAGKTVDLERQIELLAGLFERPRCEDNRA